MGQGTDKSHTCGARESKARSKMRIRSRRMRLRLCLVCKLDKRGALLNASLNICRSLVLSILQSIARFSCEEVACGGLVMSMTVNHCASSGEGGRPECRVRRQKDSLEAKVDAQGTTTRVFWLLQPRRPATPRLPVATVCISSTAGGPSLAGERNQVSRLPPA
jgi:hypothetical protein